METHCLWPYRERASGLGGSVASPLVLWKKRYFSKLNSLFTLISLRPKPTRLQCKSKPKAKQVQILEPEAAEDISSSCAGEEYSFFFFKPKTAFSRQAGWLDKGRETPSLIHSPSVASLTLFPAYTMMRMYPLSFPSIATGSYVVRPHHGTSGRPCTFLPARHPDHELVWDGLSYIRTVIQ